MQCRPEYYGCVSTRTANARGFCELGGEHAEWTMDYAHIKKYSRRLKNAEWAYERLRCAIEGGSMYRAQRATYLTQALSIWLDKNAPLDIYSNE
jgi:hypothetical protein